MVVIVNDANQKKVKPSADVKPVYVHTISGFWKILTFDNGAKSVSFVIDRSLVQGFSLKTIGEKLTDQQNQLVEYSTLKFSRDNISDLVVALVDYLEATKPKDMKN